MERAYTSRLYLWSQIEPQIAVVGQSVLHQQRDLIAQAEPDLRAQAAGLAEVDQVFERECEPDRFAEVDLDVLALVFNVGVWSQRNRAVADVSAALERDAVFRALDCDWMAVSNLPTQAHTRCVV